VLEGIRICTAYKAAERDSVAEFLKKLLEDLLATRPASSEYQPNMVAFSEGCIRRVAARNARLTA